MNIRRFFVAKSIGFIIVLAVIGGFFLFNNYIYQEKQGSETTPESYRAFLEGVYVCLPYRDDNEVKPPKQECEPAIRTNVGEHYAINFRLMSETHSTPKLGQAFSANGVITDQSSDPNKWKQYDFEGVFSVTDSLILLDEDNKTTSLVSTSLGNQVMTMDVEITPKEIISDSRCPATVECIRAGTVEVRTTLATKVAHGEHILTVGKSQNFGDYTVTLTEVAPDKTEETIPNDSYLFTYSVSLKQP